MASTIRIAILANAAKAKAEMKSVASRAREMGERIGKAGLAFAKAAAPVASFASLIGPLTASVLGLVKGLAAVGQGAAAMAPLLAFAPSLIGGFLLLRSTLSSVSQSVIESLHPITDAFDAAQKAAGNLAQKGLTEVGDAFVKANMPAIASAMARIGVETNKNVRFFGDWVNSAPGVKLIKDTTDGIAAAFERAAPSITAAAISLAQMANRANVSERLAKLGDVVGDLADKFNAWTDSVSSDDIDGALRKAGDAAEFLRNKLDTVRGVIDWMSQNQSKVSAMSDALAVFGIALGIATGNPLAIAIGGFTLLSNHMDVVKRKLVEVKAALEAVPQSTWDGIAQSGRNLGLAMLDAVNAVLALARALTGSESNLELFLQTLRVARAGVDLLVVSVYGSVASLRTVEAAVYGVIAGYKLLTGDVDGAKRAWAQARTASDQASEALAKQSEGLKALRENWKQGGEDIKAANAKVAEAAILSALRTTDAHDRGARKVTAAHVAASAGAAASQLKIGADAEAAATKASTAHAASAKSVVRSWDGAKSGISGQFSGVGGLLVSAGSSIMSGLERGLRSGWNSVKSFLNWTTTQIPNYKGPLSKDKRLLVGSGQAVMGGFLRGLSTQYEPIKASLSQFTRSIAAPSVTGGGDFTLPSSSSASPGAVGPPIVIEFAATGDVLMDAIFEEFRKRIRVRGGNVQVVLGR